MKNIFLLVFVSIMFSCKNETKQQALVIDNPVLKKVNTIQKDTSQYRTDFDLTGFYVGSFQAANYDNVHKKNGSYHNKINISIDDVKNDSMYGHSIVAGNSRPFRGTIDHKTLFAIVSEPGDDKYDGIFEFTFYPEKKKIKGIWIADNQKLAVPKRRYSLNKKEYEYNPDLNLSFEAEYEYNLALYDSQDDEGGEMEAVNPEIISKLNASKQLLTNQDIENLNKGELEVLRNLIYARHGYSFKNRKMRYFFDSQIEWYIPVSTDIRNKLTDLEKKNIELIKRYEQHAERYYDYFGR